MTSPFLAGNKAKASLAVIMVFLLTLMVLLFGAVVADAQDPDPDPDPVYYYPDASSNVGDIVLNPATDWPAPSKWSNPNVRIGFGFERRHAALPL